MCTHETVCALRAADAGLCGTTSTAHTDGTDSVRARFDRVCALIDSVCVLTQYVRALTQCVRRVQLTQVLCGTTSTAAQYDFFCSVNGFGRRLLTQLAPAILVILWQNAVMPLTLYSISLAEGTQKSLSDLDCRILLLFFYWDVFNIFFGGMIGGSITQQLNQFINNPQGITTQLGTAMPSSSNFFINYLALRSFGLVPFRLILPHGGIWRFIFKCAPSSPSLPYPFPCVCT